MLKKKVIAFVLLLVVTMGAIAGCSFFVSSTLPNINQENQQGKVLLTISAAASLRDVLGEINLAFNAANKSKPQLEIRHNFGGSGELQQQIVNGAPVDIFISAAAKQMDELQNQNLIVQETRRNLLSNRLVLVVPVAQGDIQELKDLTNANITKIAIADPRSVPAGQYAEQVFTKLELLPELQSKFVLGNNVRQVLQFVESGNAQAGIVYATDAKIATNVKVLQVIDPQLHKPIVYPIAVLRRSNHQASAKVYLEFLSSEPAKNIFEKYGFSTL